MCVQSFIEPDVYGTYDHDSKTVGYLQFHNAGCQVAVCFVSRGARLSPLPNTSCQPLQGKTILGRISFNALRNHICSDAERKFSTYRRIGIIQPAE